MPQAEKSREEKKLRNSRKLKDPKNLKNKKLGKENVASVATFSVFKVNDLSAVGLVYISTLPISSKNS